MPLPFDLNTCKNKQTCRKHPGHFMTRNISELTGLSTKSCKAMESIKCWSQPWPWHRDGILPGGQLLIQSCLPKCRAFRILFGEQALPCSKLVCTTNHLGALPQHHPYQKDLCITYHVRGSTDQALLRIATHRHLARLRFEKALGAPCGAP